MSDIEAMAQYLINESAKQAETPPPTEAPALGDVSAPLTPVELGLAAAFKMPPEAYRQQRDEIRAAKNAGREVKPNDRP